MSASLSPYSVPSGDKGPDVSLPSSLPVSHPSQGPTLGTDEHGSLYQILQKFAHKLINNRLLH